MSWTCISASALAGLLALSAPQFTSSVNQVEIYASVTDSAGRPVEGLRLEDFDVREDGVAQRISVFSEGDFPLSAAVAVDSSFSMTGERLAVAKSAARIFLGALRAEDQSMLMSIGGEVAVIAPLSTDRDAQHRALTQLASWGSTSLHDAIIDAIERLQPATGRRALVLLSDGDDRYSAATAADVLARARRADVMVYPVALGRRLPPLFSEIAALTGGRAFHERSTRRLPGTLRTIADELRRQYLIGYAPARPASPRARRSLARHRRAREPSRRDSARAGRVLWPVMSHPLVLALFDSPAAAARAAASLHAQGVQPQDLSVVARSHDEEVAAARALDATPGVEMEDSLPAARLGELGAYVVAAMALVMPGVGPVVTGGPLAAEFGEAAGHAAGSLADHLEHAGLSRVDADVAEAAVEKGSWLLGAHVRQGDPVSVAASLSAAGATAVYQGTWS